MNNKILIFDLDNTLYSPDYCIYDYFNKRIEEYISVKLNTNIEKAKEIKTEMYKKYGLTGIGLEKDYGLNFLEYLDFMHDINVETILKKDEILIEKMMNLSNTQYIFSNSIKKHANAVLETLGIKQFFKQIFTIEDFNYNFKPNLYVYQFLLSKINEKPENCYFYDDYVSNLDVAKQLGFNTILVHSKLNGSKHNHIESIYEYDNILKN